MTMRQEITPIAVRPWTLNGISERMIVSHYENNYGAAVRTLNAVRRELAQLDAGTAPYRLRTLKREEHSAMGSVALHELYFGNLGDEGSAGLGRLDWHQAREGGARPDPRHAAAAPHFAERRLDGRRGVARPRSGREMDWRAVSQSAGRSVLRVWLSRR